MPTRTALERAVLASIVIVATTGCATKAAKPTAKAPEQAAQATAPAKDPSPEKK